MCNSTRAWKLCVLTILAGAVLANNVTPADGNVDVIPDHVPVVPYKRFNVQYTVRDIGGAGPKAVSFYITTDGGKTWRKYGDDPNARSPMPISVPGDGIYGFVTVGTDQVGNREREPVAGTRPEYVIVVDRTVPTAKWLAPSRNGLLDPRGITFAWEASDLHLRKLPVSIEYSTDQGVSWLPLKNRLAARGRYHWKPPADIGNRLSFRLVARDRANNRLTLKNDYTTTLDNTPPSVRITGPSLSKALDVDIAYQSQDNKNGTGLSRVTLYYTTDYGDHWKRYGDDPDLKGPIRFTSPTAGSIGLMLVATDKAHNHTPLPQNGTAPAFTLEIDNEPPNIHTIDVDFKNPSSRVLRGGETHTIRWSATDAHIKLDSATLAFSRDGGKTWKKINSGLSVNGPYTWQAPGGKKASAYENCYLRISVADTLGNIGRKESLRFSIDGTPPEVTITEVEGIKDNGTDAVPPGLVVLPPDELVPVPEKPVIKKTPPPIKVKTNGEGDLWEPSATAKTRPLKEIKEPENTTVRPVVPPKIVDTLDIPNIVDKPVIEKRPIAIPEPKIPKPLPPVAGAGRVEALITRAKELLKQGRFQDAITRLLEAISLDPKSAEAHGVLAGAHAELGDYAKAAQYARKAVRLDQQAPTYWMTLGEAYYKQAIEHHREMGSETLSPARLTRLIEQRDRALEKSQTAFLEVTRLRPRQKDGHDRLGDILHFMARTQSERNAGLTVEYYHESIKAYKKGFNIGKVKYREAFQIGQSYYRLYGFTTDKDYLAGAKYGGGAQHYLERAIEEAADDIVPKEAFWYLALVHEASGNLRDAYRYWTQAGKAYSEDSPREKEYRAEAREKAARLRRILQKR